MATLRATRHSRSLSLGPCLRRRPSSPPPRPDASVTGSSSYCPWRIPCGFGRSNGAPARSRPKFHPSIAFATTTTPAHQRMQASAAAASGDASADEDREQAGCVMTNEGHRPISTKNGSDPGRGRRWRYRSAQSRRPCIATATRALWPVRMRSSRRSSGRPGGVPCQIG